MYRKKCFVCKVIKTKDRFFLDKSKKDNLTYACKDCIKIQYDKYKLANKEKCRLASKRSVEKHKKRWGKENPYSENGFKKCSKCKKIKNKSKFYRDKSSKDGLLYICKKCSNKYFKKWREKNTERYRELANRRSKKWRINNPKRHIEIKKRYRNNNPEKSRKFARRRRVLKAKVRGSFTIEEWVKLKKKYNYTCPSCFKKEPNIYLEPDHIIPLSKSGTDYISNIQPLCGYCNGVKWNRIMTIYELRQIILKDYGK